MMGCMVKSKLSLRSGSNLEAIEPRPSKRGYKVLLRSQGTLKNEKIISTELNHETISQKNQIT